MSTLPQPITVTIKPKHLARFWKNVEKSDGCWIWRGVVTSAGYGVIYVRPKNLRAHRVSWHIHFGPIPQGMFICHTCDNPRCVRPDHLFVGSPRANHDDMKRKGRAPTDAKNGSATRPDRVARGERHGVSRLTDAQVIEIRTRYRRGDRHGNGAGLLAREYGVSKAAVRRIVLRLYWRHLE